MFLVLMSLFFLYLFVITSLTAEVNKVERVEHNPVELTIEVPRPVVIEKTIEASLVYNQTVSYS